MKKKILTLTIILACTAMVALFCGRAMAKVTGVCSNCHTMHNSQGGTEVDAGGPYGALLNSAGGCVGCHTGTNDGSGIYPFVFSATATYTNNGVGGDTLAGGNFRWVEAGTNAHGHNVEGIAAYEMQPPGFPGDQRGGRPATWAADTQLTCAGTYGCHGDPAEAGSAAGIKGAHHGTASFGDAYRWLKGIDGLEMNTDGNKWEYQATNSKHNQYKGKDRTSETDMAGTDTISYLCGQCHGDFHAHADLSEGAWGSAWKRHPTDFDMGNVSGSEYGSYNGAGTIYSVQAPVASVAVDAMVTGDVFAAADKAIVMCLSCHRAHGTSNNDLLRWEYAMDAGSDAEGDLNTGCFICHTTKDDA